MPENILLVNEETGEIMDRLTEDNYIGSKSQDELRKSFAIEKQFRSEGKNFIFTIYNSSYKFLEQEKLKPSDITRLVVLATYINYDGRLMKTERTIMSEKDIRQIVRIKRKDDFVGFLDRNISLKLITKEEDGYYLNQNYFCKGRLGRLKKDNLATRIYCESVRHIFKNIKSGDIKRIGHLFQLIPYVNYNYNIICWNPKENNVDYIKPILMKDLEKILAVTDKSLKAIVNSLTGIRLQDKRSVLCRVKLDRDNRTDKLVVNPDVMYKGKLSGKPLDTMRVLFV